MPLSLDEVIKKLLSLNSPDKPYLIEQSGNQIVGTWNVLDANWLGILSASKAEIDYKITVDLDEMKHKYSYIETLFKFKSSFGWSGIGLKYLFSQGKMRHWEKGIVIGLGMRDKNQSRQIIGATNYKFRNSDIKNPILSILKESGWTDKSRFLSKIFG